MVEDLLEHAKDILGYQRPVKVRIRPLKMSIARVSFKYGTITLDPAVLNLEEEEMFYILIHELAHLKAETSYHSSSFWREVEKVFPGERAKEIEDRIMTKLQRNMV
uniref:Proabylysin n=1 Tax=Pyrococcus abyssi (strain GE5 / Orsay) TaxID=272844 RepID=UPI0003422796|nr:Chain A, Proabylysin [Pyrococcus abyssi GE5]